MELKQELEIVQISIYCDIVMMLLKEHKTLSLIKLPVFSYLTKKENLIQNSVFRTSNIKEIVNKYLSLLSGDLDNFFITLSLFKKSDLQLYSKRSASIFVLIFTIGLLFS